jgi:uncharacterized protein (TIGR03790 family)
MPSILFRHLFVSLPLAAVLFIWSTVVPAGAAAAQGLGAEVVVVYNSRVPDSKEVAEYYAKRRKVPKAQVFGLDLPISEVMTRKEYLDNLERPLREALEKDKLLIFSPIKGHEKSRRVTEAKIRYAVLCYGVPTTIQKDLSLKEAGVEELRPELQRTEAAVDSQLALLPIVSDRLAWAGPFSNPLYKTKDVATLHSTNGLLMVTRLDGPSAAIARGLVDGAINAETNGLWGRAYFDARGLGTNDTYYQGDYYMKRAAAVARQFGFETELDTRAETFHAGYPLSHVALYAGWYDTEVSGPFTRSQVEFMPGAFAYHLYSYSAKTIRSSSNSWVGTLLEKGATCTMGAVDEPYLFTTPDISVFINRITFGGFTFGEAAHSAQRAFSWQTTIIGDPLYRPFGRSFQALHEDLQKRGSELEAWSHLLVVNRNLEGGANPDEMIRYVRKAPISRRSAVLTEKVGDIYWAKKSLGDGVDTTESALKRGPSRQQTVRLLMKAAQQRTLYGPAKKAYRHYDTLLRTIPDYPEPLGIYQLMLPLAKRTGDEEAVQHCEEEIKRLTVAEAGGARE